MINSNDFQDQNPIVNTYFRWLANKLGVTENDIGMSYWVLLSYLHVKVFRWSVPNDENRVIDGVNLREDFKRDTDFDEDDYKYLNRPCSILEMLVGLAKHIEDSILYDGYTDHIPVLFWDWIENLGLKEYHDIDISDFKLSEVEDILETWMNRDYSDHGYGSPFPVSSEISVDRMEIWDQACRYLNENIAKYSEN